MISKSHAESQDPRVSVDNEAPAKGVKVNKKKVSNYMHVCSRDDKQSGVA